MAQALNHIVKIQKRDGSFADFNQEKITQAIFKALTAANEGNQEVAQAVSDKVVEFLNRRFKQNQIPRVEQIQDIVEECLIIADLVKTAKAFILYREQRRKMREMDEIYDEAVEIYDKYIGEMDWQIKENANMAYSLQGLNNYGVGALTKRYWLNKIYTAPIRQAFQDGDFHIHDLDVLGAYCCGWDLMDLLLKGFGGVAGKVECGPAKHLRSALGQVVNFLYTLQGECYASDTEILTENGWKLFPDIKDGEKVFTLNNKTNLIELQAPSRFYEFDHNGPVLNFRSKKIDLLVTENHNMVVDQYCPGCKTQYHRKFVKAKDFNPNLHFIPKQALWNPAGEFVFVPQARKQAFCCVSSLANQENFALPEINIRQYRYFGDYYENIVLPNKDIAIDDWLAFFGFFIAEGSTSLRKRIRVGGVKPYFEYQVRIFQNIGDNAFAFENILKKLPFHCRKSISGKKIEFRICDKQLYFYLQQFGKAGDKFVPQEIKNLPKEKLQILFDWMMRGDGHIQNGLVEYSTKSKKLADDMQEIALKLGWSANIYLRTKGAFYWYDVGISRAKRFRFRSKENNIFKMNYNGKVYCVEVPNHTLYVRRNGKACWCGNSAGAQAFSNFDTLLAPFIRYDKLSYEQVKECMQSFLFNCAVPTRVGFQTPFSNITLDIKPSVAFASQPVIVAGKPQNEVYGQFQEEMNMFNKAFYEVMMEGDKNGRIFTFPIPTINITKDFPWDEPYLEPMWEATAKYGVNYFANFIQSDMKPEDVRSMCCRLRLDNKELYKRGGGLFGANPKTGSLGVVTINMPRLGFLSKTKAEFFQRLKAVMDLSKDSLEIKRKAVEDLMKKGLYPYSRYYLEGVEKMRLGNYYGNHFSTIGLLGMNECLLNFTGENIASANGQRFSKEILDFMRAVIIKYQEETGNLYNLESTPAEGASFRLALKDKAKYPEIIAAGTRETPYYTNSSQLPVNYTDDIFEALDLQDELQCKYTGGTVAHLFLGEKISNHQTIKSLIQKVFASYKLPYITLTPTFSVCPAHGYLSGEHWQCPKCAIPQNCEVYSRIVGYLRPVQQWHQGKAQEFKERKVFQVKRLHNTQQTEEVADNVLLNVGAEV